MTNRDKVLEVFFDNIDKLPNYSLARFLAEGIDCDDCFCADECANNHNTCSQNLIEWLEKDVKTDEE